MMTTEVEEFLSHFGVKGMKWGVVKRPQELRAKRAQRTADVMKKAQEINPNRVNARAAIKSQKKADYLRRIAEGKTTPRDKAIRIAKGAAFVGVMFVLFAPVKKVNDLPKTAPKSVVDIIKQTQNEQMSSLTRTFREGHMSKEQYEQFAKTLNQRYARKIAEAAKGGL